MRLLDSKVLAPAEGCYIIEDESTIKLSLSPRYTGEDAFESFILARIYSFDWYLRLWAARACLAAGAEAGPGVCLGADPPTHVAAGS
jgi:hypothetical protein